MNASWRRCLPHTNISMRILILSVIKDQSDLYPIELAISKIGAMLSCMAGSFEVLKPLN